MYCRALGSATRRLLCCITLNFREHPKSETRTYTEASSEADDKAILFGPFQFELSCSRLTTNIRIVPCIQHTVSPRFRQNPTIYEPTSQDGLGGPRATLSPLLRLARRISDSAKATKMLERASLSVEIISREVNEM